MTSVSRAFGVGVATALCASVAACGPGGDDDATVVVLAAASLADAFGALETAFERANDGIEVEMSFAGSSAVVLQVQEGAPVDAIALANESLLDNLVDQRLAADPTVFATNSLTIAVPVDNAAGVTSIADFTDEALLLGACAAQVPCGDYAAEVFAAEGIDPALDTEAPDVASLTATVAAGELDAALVYTTDVSSRPDELVSIPLASKVNARYPIATIGDGANTRRFVDFVLSDEGRRILADAGFGLP